jgi:hypothetical protein
VDIGGDLRNLSNQVSELVAVVPVLASERDQLTRPRHHGTALRGYSGHGHTSPSTELDKSLFPQRPKRSEHRVGIDTENSSEISRRRQPITGASLAVGERATKRRRHLFV